MSSRLRTEFKHPVLSMMGIPRLRIPSRNWLIFWGITGSFVGAYYWDRRERKEVRDYWVDRVAPLGEQLIDPYDVPRKLKVYIVPPPNDYLDPSLQYFRNFIKPVLTSAAVDHEIISEERQGYIRSKVAEEIRKLRANLQGNASEDNKSDEVEERIDSHWKRDLTGGTMIIGRGAYKEYLSGLQEGWFGPIERPAFVQEQMDKEKAEERERLKKRHEENAKDTDAKDQFNYEKEEDWEEDRKARLHREFPVIPAYVRCTELNELELPAEFANREPKPISVFRHPHLIGILQTPWRIYRWLNQRHLAEEMGEQVTGVVIGETRPFILPEDADLALSDEADWPNSFRSAGIDKDSEWLREFRVDPRIAAALKVYTNASRVVPKPLESKGSDKSGE